MFVETNQQSALFLTAVVITDRTAQQRNTVTGLGNGRDILGQEILMLHRGHGMLNTHHRANLIATVAARIDDDLSLHIALFSMNSPSVIGVLGQASDRGMTVDFGTSQTGTTGQSLTQLGGINMTIGRIPQSAQQVLG